MRQVIGVDKCTKNDLDEMKKGKSMSNYMIGERERTGGVTSGGV